MEHGAQISSLGVSITNGEYIEIKLILYILKFCTDIKSLIDKSSLS